MFMVIQVGDHKEWPKEDDDVKRHKCGAGMCSANMWLIVVVLLIWIGDRGW